MGSKINDKRESLWQDRDVRFDVPLNELKLRNGERIVEYFSKIEDTKGNAGEEGKVTITNLRLIWQSKIKPRINLSVGLGCVSSLTNRTIHTKLRGKHEALYIMTKVNGTRYEFIFTQLDLELGTQFGIVQLISKVCRAYTSTKLFRDLKLRSAVITPNSKQLKVLSSETIYNKIDGVWNLSSDQGNLGTMHLTSVRVVWHANMNELFNISLPYIQISNIKVRESKFGVALVIESTDSSGGYVLGFRIDPSDRMNAVYSELINLFTIHSTKPDLGVDSYLEMGSSLAFNDHESNAALITTSDSDLKEIDDQHVAHQSDAIAAYLADEAQSKNNEIVYCPQLGLAIEKIKEGFTLESLWQVIPQG
ncbi:Bardet-Biedl syndrome 5 protein homolog [Oppia nitens]|uniref:Bardet-Biedl syndrome 5 protein homolog n=1 Tax=Oppia nitens TaxID=1686743 RepID=UPI0023DAEFAF|nr:Bardet-Biedl syndrome 5 protein homolog [Oppia nitens]